MAFKLPAIPKLSRVHLTSKNRDNIKSTGLPVTKADSLELMKTIGSGSFGIVRLCRKGEERLIMKELIDNDVDNQRLFLKEANMMHTLIYENIVKFHSILDIQGRDITAFLMEYVTFDFNYFGLDNNISTLKELLFTLDKEECKGFEHLHNIIAQDVSNGLLYLHENDVVHRDLKPENILVSNQHYNASTLQSVWETKPVVAKLSDFGESRATLVQTATLVHTRTNKVFRGSPIYMAPELHLHDGEKMFGMEELKNADVWSLAMIVYVLLNPDCKYPFEEELKDAKKKGLTCGQEILKQISLNKELPRHSTKYAKTRIDHWSNLQTVFEQLAKYSIRPTARTVSYLLEQHTCINRNDRYRFVLYF